MFWGVGLNFFYVIVKTMESESMDGSATLKQILNLEMASALEADIDNGSYWPQLYIIARL